MAFALAPADAEFVDARAPYRYAFAMPLAASAEDVWAALVDDRPLSWVHGLSVRWTSPRPFGIGTSRVAAGVFGAIRLDERFFRWEEGRRYSFTAVSANLPTFRRFAEDYLVEPATDGCVFTWTFAVEARGPRPMAATTAAIQRPAFAAMARDTRRHFGERPAR